MPGASTRVIGAGRGSTGASRARPRSTLSIPGAPGRTLFRWFPGEVGTPRRPCSGKMWLTSGPSGAPVCMEKIYPRVRTFPVPVPRCSSRSFRVGGRPCQFRDHGGEPSPLDGSGQLPANAIAAGGCPGASMWTSRDRGLPRRGNSRAGAVPRVVLPCIPSAVRHPDGLRRPGPGPSRCREWKVWPPPSPRGAGWSNLQRGLLDNYHHYKGAPGGGPKHPGSAPAAHWMPGEPREGPRNPLFRTPAGVHGVPMTGVGDRATS